MRKRNVTIQAGNTADAIKKASFALNTSPDNVHVEETSAGQFAATFKKAPAEMDIEIRNHGLEAVILRYEAPIGHVPVTEETFHEALRQAGVICEPDPQGLQEALSRCEDGSSPEGIVLARGIPPHSPGKASITPMGNLDHPVFPGIQFAEVSLPEKGTPGVSVMGEPIPVGTGEKTDGFALDLGANCEQRDTAITSTVYGLAAVRKAGASVRPLIEATPDKFYAFGTIYERDAFGSRIDLNRLADVLRRMSITVPLQEEDLRDALRQAQETRQPQSNVLFCSGIKPIDGEDGRLELTRPASMEIGAETESGRVDYRERGAVHSVETGEVLGKLIPPTQGTPGMNIFGEPLPAKPGSPAQAQAGDNVEASADGTVFTAKVAGMVVVKDNKLSVTEVFEIKGDVDYSVGNIRMEKGSVHIHGTIRSGFEVTAAGNVVVDQSIESATVEAGGNVSVGHGILMHDGGLVRAGGSISAHFAENAKLEAGENIVVDNDMTGCDATAKGKILVFEGKGRIQGGVLRAGMGIVANEIGSNLNVATPLIVGLEPEGRAELLKRQGELEETGKRIDAVLGAGDMRSILMRTPPTKRKAVAELLKTKIVLLKKLEEIEAALAALQEKVQKSTKARVQAHKTVHPGVTIDIAHALMTVKQPMKTCQFYYHPRKHEIRVASLNEETGK